MSEGPRGSRACGGGGEARRGGGPGWGRPTWPPRCRFRRRSPPRRTSAGSRPACGRTTTPTARSRPTPTGARRPAAAELRVLILPHLGDDEAALFKEFRLDEPWDGPHNRTLLDRMPKAVRPAGRAPGDHRRFDDDQAAPATRPAEPHLTYFRVFTGPGTVFEEGRRVSLADVKDGADRTVLVVECASPCRGRSPKRWARTRRTGAAAGTPPLAFHGGLLRRRRRKPSADAGSRRVGITTDRRRWRGVQPGGLGQRSAVAAGGIGTDVHRGERTRGITLRRPRRSGTARPAACGRS